MKKLLLLSITIIISGSLLTHKSAAGQEVFGQKAKSNTLTPVSELEEMDYDDLPPAVLELLRDDKYAGWKVDKVYVVGKRSARKEAHYTIRFKEGKDNLDVYVDENGNVIDPQGSDTSEDVNSSKNN